MWVNACKGGIKIGNKTYQVQFLSTNIDDEKTVYQAVQNDVVNKGVKYIFAPFISSLANQTAWAATDARFRDSNDWAIVMASYTLCDYVFSSAHTGLYGLATTLSQISTSMMKMLAIKGVTTAAVISTTEEDSVTFLETFIAAAPLNGIKVVGNEVISTVANSSEIYTTVARIASTQPDLFVGLTEGVQCTTILEAAKDLNFAPKAFMPGLCTNVPADINADFRFSDRGDFL